MDKFEKLIKASAESYEAPYSESAWTALSKKLGPEKSGFSNWAYASIVAVVAVAAGVWYYMPSTAPAVSSLAKLEAQSVNTISASSKAKGNETESNENKIVTETLAKIKEQSLIEAKGSESENIKMKNNSLIHGNDKGQSSVPISANAKMPNQINSVQNLTGDNQQLKTLQPKTEKPFDDLSLTENKVNFGAFNVQLIASTQTICAGEEVSFSPSIPKLKAIYQWNFGQDDLVQGAYATKQFTEPGVYQVSLNILDPKTREVVNTSESVSIHVHALPLNEISYEYANTAMPKVHFKQKNAFITAINWDIKGVNQTNEVSFSQDFRYKGNYVVSCTVTDDFGCRSTTNTVVAIENDYNLLAPSAFTPNGDNLNETFIPKALLIEHPEFIMTIYDKAGKLVFETNDASRPWDGMDTRSSRPVNDGAYVWIVQLTNNQNQVETYQGQVTITR